MSNNLLPDKMTVVRRYHNEYEVWVMGTEWTTPTNEQEYSGVYTNLVATFTTEHKAKQYVGITENTE